MVEKRKLKILITGASGFTGLHACRHFKKVGCDIIAVSRTNSAKITDETIHTEQCDLTDKFQVSNLIKKINPDRVLHLAGQNNVQDSWMDPITSLEANVMSTALLMEALRQENPSCKIVIVGSALQADLAGNAPPQHPYSLSKTIQVLLAQAWESLYGMDIVVAKPSNLIGPGDSNGVCSVFARRVAEMELFQTDRVLLVNNLKAQRDFIDVRDAVRAYEKLFHIGKAGIIYDITSGKPRRLQEVTDALQMLSTVKINIETLENKNEMTKVVKPTKLLETGWKPLIPFEKSIEDILNYHRRNLL